MWDPDGAGPLVPRLVGAGDFQTLGNIVSLDPGTGDWLTLANGIGFVAERIEAVAALPGGDLVAAGYFEATAGRRRIARWNGTQWLALASGLGPQFIGSNSSVRALTILANGDLVAAGWIPTASGVTVNHIARWDGVAWSALGSGMNGWVDSLTTMANGDVIAGGTFTSAGGVSTTGLARRDGSVWSAIASGASVNAQTVTALSGGGGGLIVAGDATNNAMLRIEHWDGSAW